MSSDTDIKRTLKIQINGQSQVVDSPATIASLIELRQPRPPFAVEVNKQLIRREQYATTDLGGGDVVEIVTLVGGG